MKQYEIRWAHLPEPMGVRPVLLLTRTTAYAYLNAVAAAQISARVRGIPQEVRLGRNDGMPKPCAVKLDAIQLVDVRALGSRITQLAPSRIVEVKRAVGYAFRWLELVELR